MEHYLSLQVTAATKQGIETALLEQARSYFGEDTTTHKLYMEDVNVEPMLLVPSGRVMGYSGRAYAKMVRR